MDAGRPTLTEPMQAALELAWASTCAGSFGVGAVAVDTAGAIVATGRNRGLERDPGDDVIAGTSVAHAEMNVLAKLPFRAHHGVGLTLHTTLQPCIQCLGAIRLSSVERVVVLAPDPLWRGIEALVAQNEFVGRNPPSFEELPVTEWSVFSLLLLSHLNVFWDITPPGWADAIPSVMALAHELVSSGELVEAAVDGAPLDEVSIRLWDRLSACVSEVAGVGTG